MKLGRVPRAEVTPELERLWCRLGFLEGRTKDPGVYILEPFTLTAERYLTETELMGDESLPEQAREDAYQRRLALIDSADRMPWPDALRRAREALARTREWS